MSISEIYDLYVQFPNICTDSRKVVPNSIYFSLKGERFNGNKFAKQGFRQWM